MAFLHDEGELLVLSNAFDGRDVEIGLFDNTVDSIAEGDTYTAISSEPDGTDYAKQTVTGPTVSQSGGVTEVDMGALSFNVGDATTSADYVFVRDVTSGDLILTNSLDQAYDLGSIDVLDLSNVGMELS